MWCYLPRSRRLTGPVSPVALPEHQACPSSIARAFDTGDYRLPQGQARYEILSGGGIIREGAMQEYSPGRYRAVVEPLYPNHGMPGQALRQVRRRRVSDGLRYLYRPKWLRQNHRRSPNLGATVTLYSADSIGGVYNIVPNGSAVMSSANRTNPDRSDSQGRFGWEVVTGFYKVRVEKSGCWSPGNPSQLYVESAPLTIPPPVTDLELQLECMFHPFSCPGNEVSGTCGQAIVRETFEVSQPRRSFTIP